jgi:hypothetical protein
MSDVLDEALKFDPLLEGLPAWVKAIFEEAPER